MTRRTYVYDPDSKEMVEVTRDRIHPAYNIHVPVDQFLSPVDGKVYYGARGYREHNKRNNVVPHEMPAKRDPAFQEARERRERISALSDSYEKHRNEERARRRYG